MTSSRDSEFLFFCPSPDGSWGVFASNRHSENLRLYRTELGRSALLYAIPGADAGNNIFPAVSPDGGRLAFASDRDGTWRIYLLRLGSRSVPQAITPDDGDCLCPAWEPKADSGAERLAFCRFNRRSARWEVWLLELQTGQTAPLGPGLFPAWSPDGTYVAVQRPRGRGAAQYGLWLLRVDGSGPERELFMAEDWATANPAWSPDGKFLVFNTVGRSPGETLAGDGGGVYGLPVNGSGWLLGPLPYADRNAWRPVWASNGKIYFHRREGGAVNIFAVDAATLDLTPQLAEDVR
jgi:TolB protein